MSLLDKFKGVFGGKSKLKSPPQAVENQLEEARLACKNYAGYLDKDAIKHYRALIDKYSGKSEKEDAKNKTPIYDLGFHPFYAEAFETQLRKEEEAKGER
jgi:hypothetical protein